MTRTLAVLMLAVAVSGCRVHYDDPVVPTTAVVSVTVAPDPLRLLWVCPPGSTNCFGSLDATIAVRETGGVPGRVDFMDVHLYDVAAARSLLAMHLDTAWLQQNVGTDRVAANGQLAMRTVIEGYPFPAGSPRPPLEFILAVRFIDDLGNIVDTNRRLPLT